MASSCGSLRIALCCSCEPTRVRPRWAVAFTDAEAAAAAAAAAAVLRLDEVQAGRRATAS